MTSPTPATLLTIAAVSAVGGAINAIAGGGTLLTFPALLGLGIPAISANATSTVALWPGSAASLYGYRHQVAGAEAWARRLVLPSTVGGLVGAVLLLAPSEERFRALVPWLVLGATVLFAINGPLMRWLQQRTAATPQSATDHPQLPSTAGMVLQFLVGAYGGYFGAGAGIMMLASFRYMGLTNIHQMNGLKNINGLTFNLVAALTFALKGLVLWPIALVMALGSMAGGYLMAGLAQRVPQAWVRGAVTVIGVGSAAWLFVARG
jgi:uncharacterized membrane protein YfcA